ncbi:MAG TPA: thioredoxin-like domain-containing protein [Tepidisphaeraceae bacterium]|nr:thioredoxin-like domain-containing protein [Tepidisphaeraceae bacterium]
MVTKPTGTSDVWEQVAPLLNNTLMELEEADRVAIQEHFFARKNLKDLAACLHTSPEEAKRRLTLALEHLHVHLAKKGIDVPPAALADHLATRPIPSLTVPETSPLQQWLTVPRNRQLLGDIIAIVLLAIIVGAALYIWTGGASSHREVVVVDGPEPRPVFPPVPTELLFMGLSPEEAAVMAASAPKYGQEVPPIEATMADGSPLRFADYRGKYLLFHLWSTHWQRAAAETVGLKEVYDRFGHDERLAIVGLNLDQDRTAADAYLKRKQIAWPQAYIDDPVKAKLPREYQTTPTFIIIAGPDGKIIGKSPHRKGAYAILDRLLARGSEAKSPVRVNVEQLPPLAATQSYPFNQMPSISRIDAAKDGIFSFVDGEQDPGSAPASVLNDGFGSTNADSPHEAYFFKEYWLEGRFRVDLRRPIDVAQINTYTWHTSRNLSKSTRAAQVYKVYGSDGRTPNFNATPRFGVDPTTCGWQPIALVDTRTGNWLRGGQVGVSIQSDTGTLGRYRHLLFVAFVTEVADGYGNAFYSEVDVIEQTPAPAAK